MSLSLAGFATNGDAQAPCQNTETICDAPAPWECDCSPHVPNQPGVVSLTGSWSGSWDWSAYMDIDPLTQNPEISHAVLLTVGPYAGQVVLWRNAHRESPVQPVDSSPTETFIWDPAQPDVLARVDQAPEVNNFCGAHTFDPEGHLVVVGGGPAVNPPEEVYLFDPSALVHPPQDVGGPVDVVYGLPWSTLEPLVHGRFYPTVITMLDGTIQADPPNDDIPGGSTLVLGGKHPDDVYPDPSGTYNGGTHLIETRFPPSSGSVAGHLLAAEGHDELIPLGVDPERYTLESLPPPTPLVPTLDYYPRAFQLATTDPTDIATKQNVFVAFDVIPAAFHVGSLRPSNAAGASWVFKPRYRNNRDWEVWAGPVGQAESGGEWERTYGGAVLLHYLTHKNRVLLFGGTYSPSHATHPRLHWRRVEELSIDPSGDLEASTWSTKAHCMRTARAFHNCVVLPTGRVLLIGGSWGLSANQRERPAVCPELYDPGDPVPADNATSWRMSARPSPVPSGHPYTRLYHSVAVLLPDGNVLNAGGEDLGPTSDFPNGNFSGEVFHPPYANDPDRPKILRVADAQGTPTTTFEFGSPYLVTVFFPNGTYPGEGHPDFVFLRPASVTHHFDADQRFVELSKTLEASASPQVRVYRVWAPQAEDPGEAPPGMYSLWAVRERPGSAPPLDRLPSQRAFFVRLTN